jgi:citronellol/citronellal dehydrogenase
MPDFAGKTALITGASRGIGRAIAIEFAGAGASVALLARSTEASPSRLPGTLEETARAVEAAGGHALTLAADVRDEAQVDAAVAATLKAFRRIDILVNNAAVFYGAPFHEVPLPRWDLVLDVNLRGSVVCSQAVIPAMIEQGNGLIINVSSSVAVDLHPGMSPYAVSKAALETLTRYLATELAPHGIAANVLRIDTAVATEGAKLLNPEADIAGWSSPEDAARAALWLAAQPPSYTGQTAIMSEILGTIP